MNGQGFLSPRFQSSLCRQLGFQEPAHQQSPHASPTAYGCLPYHPCLVSLSSILILFGALLPHSDIELSEHHLIQAARSKGLQGCWEV